jgi:RNA polymerase sigma-B factor
MAREAQVTEEEVLEALAADGCFSPTSLDLPLGDQGSATLGDTLVREDSTMAEAEARAIIRPAVRTLPERERRVLYLRFFKQLSQSQIAAEVGVTQMQVSRILSRVLAQLREHLGSR